jgi:hypothetical protein
MTWRIQHNTRAGRNMRLLPNGDIASTEPVAQNPGLAANRVFQHSLARQVLNEAHNPDTWNRRYQRP